MSASCMNAQSRVCPTGGCLDFTTALISAISLTCRKLCVFSHLQLDGQLTECFVPRQPQGIRTGAALVQSHGQELERG